MAAGNVRQGLEGLNRLNWIKEGLADYLQKASTDFLRLTDQRRHLDRCLAVSFTWDQNHSSTDSIRRNLKERGVLPAGPVQLLRKATPCSCCSSSQAEDGGFGFGAGMFVGC
jgi:hypothetical protein